ncbi:MAG: nucleotidyltransferase family protein [Gemmatimonadota bacterium]
MPEATSSAHLTTPDARVTGIVPAAGSSTRMGAPKALLRLGGATFARLVVTALRDGGCAPVLFVVREGDDEAAGEAEAAGATVLPNPDPGPGPITSLRLALAGLDERVEHVVWLPLDHPRVRPETVARLIAEARGHGAPITLPVQGGRRGHPAVFSRSIFPELTDPGLEGGARTVVHRHLDEARLVETGDAGVLIDVDTPAEYEALLGSEARLSRNPR